MKWLLLITFIKGGNIEQLMNFHRTEESCLLAKADILKLNSKDVKVRAVCTNKAPKHE